MKEQKNYRDTLEMIWNAFPRQGLLTQKEVSEFLRLDPRTVKKRYGISGRVTPVELARRMIE